MAGGHPQLLAKDVGRDDLVKPTLNVLRPHKLHELAADVRATGQEEAAAGAKLVEEEEVLLRANFTVVALGGLLQQVFVFLCNEFILAEDMVRNAGCRKMKMGGKERKADAWTRT